MDTTPKHLLKERLLLLERKAADLPPSSAPWWRTEAAVVAAGSAAVVVASTAERLAFKAMVDAMPPYRYFLAQLITVAYVPLMAALAWWRVRYNDSMASGIADEMTELPKRRFALMGLLDMLSCVVLTVAAGEVRAPLTVLLLQAQLPLQALLSAAFLRVRYRATHALGVALVLAGVLVNMGPSFAEMHSGAWRGRTGGPGEGAAGAAAGVAGAGAGAGAGAAFGAANLTATGTTGTAGIAGGDGLGGGLGGHGSNPWFTLAYLLAAVPAACSAAYKESCLRATPIDMHYLNAWVSLFQFVLGLFAAPVVLKDSLGMAQKVQGVGACLRGEGWISTGSGGSGGGAGCSPAAPWLLVGYILSTLALHQALTFLVRRNAAAVYIATSVAVATAYLGLELCVRCYSPRPTDY